MLVTAVVLLIVLIALGLTVMAQLSNLISQNHDRNEMARESLDIQKRQLLLTEKAEAFAEFKRNCS